MNKFIEKNTRTLRRLINPKSKENKSLEVILKNKFQNKNLSFSFSESYNEKEYIDNIQVGKYTYGNVNILYFGNPNAKLTIGKYCSLAARSMFMLGGHHNYKSVSTFPLHAYVAPSVPINDYNTCAEKKYSITLKDDVWVGYGAMIMPGVTVGQGAVIGAMAMVTKDVPPYAIACGNPAKIIKYRLPPEIIAGLLEFADYSKLTSEKAQKYLSFLMQEEPTKDNITQFRKIFED